MANAHPYYINVSSSLITVVWQVNLSSVSWFLSVFFHRLFEKRSYGDLGWIFLPSPNQQYHSTERNKQPRLIRSSSYTVLLPEQ